MSEPKKPAGRRTFLVGLLTGAGVTAALAGAPRASLSTPAVKADAAPSGPILYRRTEEAERYYRTLYR